MNVELSKNLKDRYFRNFNSFLLNFNSFIQENIDTFALEKCNKDHRPDDFVYVFNALVIHPKIRRISRPSELCGSCLSMVEEHIRKNTLLLAQSVFKSNAYKFIQMGGHKDIYGVLNQSNDNAQTGDSVLMVCTISRTLEVFLLPHREFWKRYVLFHRNNKAR